MNPTTSPSNLGMRRRDDGMRRRDEHFVTHLAERTISKVDAALVGILLVFLGFGGMVNPGYAGLHLNLAHSLLLILTGVFSFYAGVALTVRGERTISLAFGLFYLVLALAGMAFGGDGQHSLLRVEHGPDHDLLRIIPGHLEFASYDHLLHLGLGALFLLSALLGWLGGENDEEI
jgi:hypothetical protein